MTANTVKCGFRGTMPYTALNGVRIIDLTHFIAGPYATKLLADLGAQVIKVEPPGGEGGRRLGAGGGSAHRDADRGPLFAYLNTNKLGVTINLKQERGRDLLRRLLAGADLLIENFAPSTLPALGLAPAALLAEFPRLSVVSISNFGQDGPSRDERLNDLVLFARGGWSYIVGEPDREPLTPPGSLAQYIGALYGAIGAMQALFARDLGGAGGQHVDISLLEATVATMIYDTVSFQYTGILRRREGRRFARGPFMIATLRCADGFVGVHCVTQAQFEGLCEMMGQPELARDERFRSPLARLANNDALLELVEAFFVQHDAAFLYREGQRRKIPMATIPSVAEILEWEQLKARRYFETVSDPALGTIRIPGSPLRLSSHRPTASRPAPHLGEHNRQVFAGLLKLGDRELSELESTGAI